MRGLLVLALVAFLGGCATAYQPQGLTGGFSTTQLDTNVFTVSFRGNGYTGRERTNDFALLRSAEVALENGFSHFAIIDAQQYTKTGSYTTPTQATTTLNTNTYGTVNTYGNFGNYSGNTSGTATTTVTGGQTYTIAKPRTSNTIVCFTEKPEGFAFNAAFIIDSIRAKYGISPNEAQ